MIDSLLALRQSRFISDWTDEECMAWTTVNMDILRIGFALRFPHGNY